MGGEKASLKIQSAMVQMADLRVDIYEALVSDLTESEDENKKEEEEEVWPPRGGSIGGWEWEEGCVEGVGGGAVHGFWGH